MFAAFTLVYMGMDTVPLLFLKRGLHLLERCYVGMFFGIDMMALGFLLHKYLTVEVCLWRLGRERGREERDGVILLRLILPPG